MGVKDLGAVIKKHAPSAVTQVSSLSAFANRTVAIDANLLTSKFHFTKSDSPHRHVRSWYWFLQALKREKIRPIVVFDGTTRVPEKEKENQRRRAARQQQKLRGEAEKSRGERLRQLQSAWGEVAEEDRSAVAAALKRSLVEREEGTTASGQLDERIRESAIQLGSLHSAFREDSTNPVYSRNQVLVTAEERSFFTQIVERGPTLNLDLEVQVGRDDELVRIIERSDALGQSHRSRAISIPKSAFIDTMVSSSLSQTTAYCRRSIADSSVSDSDLSKRWESPTSNPSRTSLTKRRDCAPPSTRSVSSIWSSRRTPTSPSTALRSYVASPPLPHPPRERSA